MAVLIVPNAAQIKIKWSVAGTNMLTVLGASGTNAVTVNQGTADALGSGIKSAFTTSGYAACIGTASGITKVSIRDVKIASQPEFDDSGGLVLGTNADADFLPKNVALVVTYKTLLAGKSFRGRSFLPGLVEADNSGSGLLSTVCLDAAVAFIEACEAVMTTAGLAHAVLSPALPVRTTQGGLELPAKAAFATTVTSVTTRSDIPGSQRRRLHRP